MNQIALDLQPELEYRTIPLTQGQVAIVDVGDYEWLMSVGKWQAKFHKNTGHFSATHQKYVDKKRVAILWMHREIMQAPKGLLVDHRNRNSLDNRRFNLRLATYSQNAANKRTSRKNKSGYPGVCWQKDCNKWRAYVAIDGAQKYLGLFSSLGEAVSVRSEYAKRIYGEFYCENPNVAPKKSPLVPQNTRRTRWDVVTF
jgi:HNH endonuclease